jgi:hypothetical protein
VQRQLSFATSHTNSAQNLALAVHDVLDHGGGARNYILVDAETCLYRKSDSAIIVMKSAEDGRRYDAAHVLDRALDRCVYQKSHSY